VRFGRAVGKGSIFRRLKTLRTSTFDFSFVSSNAVLVAWGL